jgi:hypothetical protein
MSTLSGGHIAILAIAAYISIVMLVRLMKYRRDEVVAQLRGQVAAEQRRKRAERRRGTRPRTDEQQAEPTRPDSESGKSAA